MTELVSIAAVAENGVIGVDGGIPWSYPADLEFFNEQTTGHTVVMGRKTYSSLPFEGGLPNRETIVLTSKSIPAPAGVTICSSIDSVMEEVERTDSQKVFIAGGESVYRQMLTHVDKLLITHIPETPTGDTYFPNWDTDEWPVVNKTKLSEQLTVVEYDVAEHY